MTIKQVLLDKDYQHIAKQVIEGFVDELDQNILEDILWDNDICKCERCEEFSERRYMKETRDYDGYICESCLGDNDL